MHSYGYKTGTLGSSCDYRQKSGDGLTTCRPLLTAHGGNGWNMENAAAICDSERIGSTTGDDIIQRIRRRAERLFQEARGSHDWEHTLRVVRLCKHIGRVEKADMQVLIIAAYLHDIGRCFQDLSRGKICHAEKGAEMALPLIASLPFSDRQKDNIVGSIRSHRYRGHQEPESIEAKILFDADKLDAIGAVGIARAYLFAGEVGARLHNPDNNIENTKPYSKDDTGYREYRVKLIRVKDRMLTPEGRRMAEDRHAFMAAFFERFLQEYNGER